MRRLLLAWVTACVALIAVWTFFPPPPTWIDRFYTGGFYAAVASVLVPLTGATRLPVTALLLAVLVLGLALRLVLGERARGWRAPLRWLRRGVVAGVTLYALFIMLWGANYARTPLETRLGLSTEVTPGTLEHIAFAEVLSNVIRHDHAAAADWNADLAAGQASLARVVEQLEGRTVTLPRYVKRTLPGFLLFTGQATGLTVPWTLEAYVDGALPYPYALATALHEAAHVAGYGSEAEADFIAAVAGLTSDNASVRYSTALTYFGRSAPRSLLPERYQAIVNYLPERFTQDTEALRRAYERYRAPDRDRTGAGAVLRRLLAKSRGERRRGRLRARYHAAAGRHPRRGARVQLGRGRAARPGARTTLMLPLVSRRSFLRLTLRLSAEVRT